MNSIRIYRGMAVLILASIVFSCETRVPKDRLPDAAFRQYIEAYTGGTVSAGASVEVHFSPAVAGKILKEPGADLASLFHFIPQLSGQAFWSDENLLEFRPDVPMKPGQLYEVTLDFGKLMRVADELKKFHFSFQVMQQSFRVDIRGIFSEYEDFGLVAARGEVLLADAAEAETVEEMIKATFLGDKLKINWQHDPSGKTSSFVIDSIPRQEEEEFLLLEWTGKGLGLSEQDEYRLAIPSRNRFELIQAKVVQSPEQYVSVLFSDPLSADQVRDGLVSITNAEGLKLSTNRNELLIHPLERMQGRQFLKIDAGLKSIFGKSLETDQEIEISFDAPYPAARFLSSGTILPQAEKLVLPFQAINLNAVDIRVIRIFEDNIPQFLQANDLGGNAELNRVGRMVLQKKIELKTDAPVDPGQWNTYFLDLSELIKVEPGAIYNVRLTFRLEYSTYPCDGNASLAQQDEDDEAYWYDREPEPYNWDSDEYFYDPWYPRGFRWREKDNPCHVSYYNGERFSTRNVLASNLGLTAKAGSDGTYLIAVTDLLTATPIGGAKVALYNFQQQKMTEATTNSDGLAEIPTDSKPFLLVAEYNNSRGYLKLADGNSLSLSKFDIEGEAIREGLKGFLYGDRGVWRPGDTLFLTFILEDETHSLPSGHPVIFELFDPGGQPVQKLVSTEGVKGFYTFSPFTAPDARTGIYQAKVTVGNVTFRKSLRIETIKPNRLKIDLAFTRPMLKANSGTTPAILSARWLHGGTSSNLKATINQLFQKSAITFPDYKGFTFEDPGKELNAEEKVIFDQKLDAGGKATVQVNTSGNFNAPGMLRTVFQIKVFEPSGEFSIDQFSLPYAPYPRFLGMRITGADRWGYLDSDGTYDCDIVCIDPEGKLTAGGQAEVMIYRLDRYWWWNSSDDDLASYFSGTFRNPVQTQKVNLLSGKATFSFSTKNMEWGKYVIRIMDPEGGHSTGQSFFIKSKYWWDEEDAQAQEFVTMLDFRADKEKYRIGEKATIIFPAGKTGKALISIENGSRVLMTDWVDITDSRGSYVFEVTAEMAPNVYCYVSLIQPHGQALNDLPIRLYGVIPILAEDPGSILKPVITAPSEIRPESKYTIRVKEEKGRAMTYTLAVVDEGLLDLTRFKTPDPWQHFFAREALGVKTWDLFDQVVGAYGAKLERVLAVGGDGSLAPGDKARVNRFKPVVEFIGPVTLRSGQEMSHTLEMPNYVGSVRVMVVAASEYPAYGMAEKAVPVKQPLMVLATLPRVLGPGEKVKLPVNVFMMEERSREVTVKVELSDNIGLQGASTKSVRFEKAGEQLVEFDLEAGPITGAATVTVEAVSGGEKASSRVDLEIRNPNPPARQHYFTRLEGGREWNQEIDYPGQAGTNSLKLDVTAGLPLDLSRHLGYLLDYPYGCAEQITSTAFPQLYLDELTELTTDQKNAASNNIRWTVNRLNRFQNRDGSFRFWPEYASANDYITSYIGHFLTEAGKKGYPVSSAMMKSWMAYQKAAAGRWDPKTDNDHVQAYRLYTMALAGDALLGAMNRLREQSVLSSSAASCLASAYALAGQKDAARRVLEKFASARDQGENDRYTYGSPLRNMAMKVEALLYIGEEEQASRLAFELAESFSKDDYYSTQTTAYVLQVLAKYKKAYVRDKELRYTYRLGGSTPEAVTTSFLSSMKEWTAPEKKGNILNIKNEGQGDIFIRLTAEGTPLTDTRPSENRNLTLKAEYSDMEGKPVNPAVLPQGKDFMMTVTATLSAMPRGQDNLALTMIFPSGWEIIRRTATGFDAGYQGDSYDYQDIRDDRVYTFFYLAPGQSKKFTVYLNSTYQGTFFLPAVSCEAMYDESVFSRLAGQWVKVVPSE